MLPARPGRRGSAVILEFRLSPQVPSGVSAPSTPMQWLLHSPSTRKILAGDGAIIRLDAADGGEIQVREVPRHGHIARRDAVDHADRVGIPLYWFIAK